MPYFETQLRPPAYRLGPASRFKAVLNFVATLILGCKHSTTTLPHRNSQRCLECGAHRLYIFTNHGIFKGKWAKANSPSDPGRILEQKPIVKGIEPGRVVTR